jgi:hypothetical protein
MILLAGKERAMPMKSTVLTALAAFAVAGVSPATAQVMLSAEQQSQLADLQGQARRVALLRQDPALPAASGASAAPKAGRGACEPDQDNPEGYTVQFGWDDDDRLTDVFFTVAAGRANSTLYQFDFDKNPPAYLRQTDALTLSADDKAGDSISLRLAPASTAAWDWKGKISLTIKGKTLQRDAPVSCSL